jgi:hypothetical protein
MVKFQHSDNADTVNQDLAATISQSPFRGSMLKTAEVISSPRFFSQTAPGVA